MTLLKKVDPAWAPAEKRGQKFDVGDTVEITDPKELILSGAAVAMGPNGEELGAFELYGVITDREKKEFEAFKNFKSQQAVQKNLEAEKEKLVKELEAAPVVKKEEPIVAPEALPVPSDEELKAKRLAALAKGREIAKANRAKANRAKAGK